MSGVRGRGRGRGRPPKYSTRGPVYAAVDTTEGSVASDVSSLSDLTSLDYERLNVSKESAPIKVNSNRDHYYCLIDACDHLVQLRCCLM